MPDALSRMPHACTISVISYSSLLQDIQTTQQRDPYTQQLISDLEMQRVAHGSPRMQQCLLMVHGKWFVPNMREIKALIWQEGHDCKMVEHFFWPHMELDVKDYAQSCVTCQQVKAWHGQPYGLLQPMPIPAQPWDVVSMDFIVDFPVSRGYNAIMVVIDYFSKQAHFVPSKPPPSRCPNCSSNIYLNIMACLRLSYQIGMDLLNLFPHHRFTIINDMHLINNTKTIRK